MAHYLVRGRPRTERLVEMAVRLAEGEFREMRPFGEALTYSLRRARREADGTAAWEEEDYCSPPLAEERRAVLDHYFEQLEITPVAEGEGWRRIDLLPRYFPELQL